VLTRPLLPALRRVLLLWVLAVATHLARVLRLLRLVLGHDEYSVGPT
jgi:hypothetical protein